MPLELWRSRGFVGANIAGLAYFFALFGILYFCSVYLQQYRNFSPLEAGLSFLPMTIVMALVGPVTGRLSARFTTTSLTVAGLLVARWDPCFWLCCRQAGSLAWCAAWPSLVSVPV